MGVGMSGQDIYDQPRMYCNTCETTAHTECEPLDPDLRYECMVCLKPIEFADEVRDTDVNWAYHTACYPFEVGMVVVEPDMNEIGEHHCAGTCQGCGAGVEDPCIEPCDCSNGGLCIRTVTFPPRANGEADSAAGDV
jgi:hypothetical protein